MSETTPAGLLGTLIERWRAKSQRPLAGSWIGPEVLNQCANELEAALKGLPPAPPQAQEQGLCRNGAKHYCPNCDRSFVAAYPRAQEQELVQRIDQSLELGRILGPEYDGATFEEIARELVALKAQVVPPAASQESATCPNCSSKQQERIAGLWLCQSCGNEWNGAASPPAQEQDKWQPIETAPDDTGKDWVIVCVRRDCRGPSAPIAVPAYREDGIWHLPVGYSLADQSPTHWMPFPGPPAQD